jgi:hypothetical protein
VKYFSNSSLLHKAHPHGNITFKLFVKSIVFKQYIHTKCFIYGYICFSSEISVYSFKISNIFLIDKVYLSSLINDIL